MAAQDFIKSNIVAGLAIGVAAAVLLPLVLPIVARAAKPFAKTAVKSGLMVYEKGRETAAELSEMMEDVVAEARAEIDQEHAATIAGTATAAPVETSSPAGKA
jgi:hypothetical protein